MLKTAIYVSDHGFGHAARVVALANELIKFGIQVRVRSSRPDFLFERLNGPFFAKVEAQSDFGVIHNEGLIADLAATKEALLRLMSSRPEIVERETAWLRDEGIDFAIVDIPFIPIEACSYAGIPVFAISNFDWAYIYSHLFSSDTELRPVINTIKSLYQRCDDAFRLPFSSSKSMESFKHITNAGLLARKKEIYQDIKTVYGLDPVKPILACTFGGEIGMNHNMPHICAAFNGYVLSSDSNVSCENHIHVPREADWLDVIHGADVLLTKPGYSTFAEATQFGTPILYIPRGGYPEEKVLIRGLRRYGSKIEIPSGFRGKRNWKKFFDEAMKLPKAQVVFRNQNSSVAAGIVASYFKTLSNHSSLHSVFDIGSNNLNYLIWDSLQNRIVHTAHFNTRIGNLSNPIAIKRFKSVFSHLLQFDLRIESRKIAISAAAARENPNFVKVSDWIQKRFQIKTTVLTQHREAKLAYKAARRSLDIENNFAVVDIGGLSTELIWGLAKHEWMGLKIGLLHLKDGDWALQESISAELPTINDSKPRLLVLTGLTGAFLASVIYKNRTLPKWAFHGLKLSLAQILELENAIANGASENWEPYLESSSDEPILKASLCFSRLLLDKYQASEIVVCYYGISLGIIT